jgi:hypothetical protein
VVLLDVARAGELSLYPAIPAQIESMRRWLENDAAKLLAMQPTLSRTVDRISRRAHCRKPTPNAKRGIAASYTRR